MSDSRAPQRPTAAAASDTPHRVRRARRALSKRAATLLVAVPALVMMLATTRTWLTGQTSDAVLGHGTSTAPGSSAAPGVIGLGLVCVVALLAVLTAGRVARVVAAVILELAALGALVNVVYVALSPSTILGQLTAQAVGRIGSVPVDATVTAWLYLALLCAAVTAVGGVLVLASVGAWSGLSSRYDSPAAQAEASAAAAQTAAPDPAAAPADPAAPAATATARGARRSAWEDLSEGTDPTLR